MYFLLHLVSLICSEHEYHPHSLFTEPKFHGLISIHNTGRLTEIDPQIFSGIALNEDRTGLLLSNAWIFLTRSVLPLKVPAKTDCVMCFGPVVPDGYGICYNPMEDHINFSVSAFNSCAETNATELAHGLEGALLDMKVLLEQTPKARL